MSKKIDRNNVKLNGFTFYRSYLDILENIEDVDERGRLALAMIEYGLDGKEPALNGPMEKLAFTAVRRTLDTSRQKGANKQDRIGSAYPEGNRNKIGTESKPNQNEIKAESNREQDKDAVTDIVSDAVTGESDRGMGEENPSETSLLTELRNEYTRMTGTPYKVFELKSLPVQDQIRELKRLLNR